MVVVVHKRLKEVAQREEEAVVMVVGGCGSGEVRVEVNAEVVVVVEVEKVDERRGWGIKDGWWVVRGGGGW